MVVEDRLILRVKELQDALLTLEESLEEGLRYIALNPVSGQERAKD